MNSNALLFLGVMATAMTIAMYPVFVLCDRRMLRRRLVPLHLAPQPTVSRDEGRRGVDTGRRSNHPTFLHSSQCLDDIGRRLRLGQSPVASFTDALRSHSILATACGDLATAVERTGTVESEVRHFMSSSDAVVRAFASAIWVIYAGPGISIPAIDRAARSHRDRYTVHEELHAASAASRYSTMILTLLPVSSVVMAPLWGTNVLSVVTQSPLAALAVLVGFTLNIVGYLWARRIGASLA